MILQRSVRSGGGYLCDFLESWDIAKNSRGFRKIIKGFLN